MVLLSLMVSDGLMVWSNRWTVGGGGDFMCSSACSLTRCNWFDSITPLPKIPSLVFFYLLWPLGAETSHVADPAVTRILLVQGVWLWYLSASVRCFRYWLFLFGCWTWLAVWMYRGPTLLSQPSRCWTLDVVISRLCTDYIKKGTAVVC